MNNRKLLVYVAYIFFIVCAVCALRFIDSLVGTETDRVALIGAVVSGILGIGILKSLPTKESHVSCPDCKELILKEAKICKYCGCKLVPNDDS